MNIPNVMAFVIVSLVYVTVATACRWDTTTNLVVGLAVGIVTALIYPPFDKGR